MIENSWILVHILAQFIHNLKCHSQMWQKNMTLSIVLALVGNGKNYFARR